MYKFISLYIPLKVVPKKGKHTNVTSGGHLTWSVKTFSEEKTNLSEMTAKQLTIFREAAGLEEYSEFSAIYSLLEKGTQEYLQGLILKCNIFINRLALEHKNNAKFSAFGINAFQKHFAREYWN